MSNSAPRYIIDLADPRAPSQAEWDSMTEVERAAVLAELARLREERGRS